MDTFIPRVPEVKPDDITTKFPHHQLTNIEVEPAYQTFYVLREELYQNAIAIESPFGGGGHGHWGSVTSATLYNAQTGETWVVPASGGVYPTFPANATDVEKKRITAEFIKTETGIKTAAVVEKLLSKQVRDAIEEEYYMELEDPIFKYSQITAYQIIDHVLQNYAVIDDQLIESNRNSFNEPPDLTRPIDIYFRRQERCRVVSIDGGVAITDSEMALQLGLHMGRTGVVNSEYIKWTQKPAADRTWANGKLHFRKAMKNVHKINNLTSAKSGMSANAITRSATEDKVRDEIQDQLGEAFDNLAMAATAKQSTMDKMTKSIAELTESVAALTKTNKELTFQLKKALTNNARGGGTTTGGSTPTTSTGGWRKVNGKSRAPNEDDDGWVLDGFCWTCGYKVRRGHTSATCKFKDNPGHKCDATRANPMGGSKREAGFGNKPDGTERQ